MTNFEKYSKGMDTTKFAVVNGKPVDCNSVVPCDECNLFYNNEDNCDGVRMEWLKSEYVEPKINIPEGTPVNTKLLVSMDGRIWKRRYYAGFKDGIHLAWCDGATSWSKDSDDRKTSWEYMKLYNEEES